MAENKRFDYKTRYPGAGTNSSYSSKIGNNSDVSFKKGVIDMSEGIKNFTDDNFAAEALTSQLPVIVDFWAVWCGPCKMLTPIIEEIAGETDGTVVIGKCNVDDNPKTAARYGVSGIPTLLFIKGGRVADQHTGLLTKKQLLDKINKLFGV